jgi:hypothetical protein
MTYPHARATGQTPIEAVYFQYRDDDLREDKLSATSV